MAPKKDPKGGAKDKAKGGSEDKGIVFVYKRKAGF